MKRGVGTILVVVLLITAGCTDIDGETGATTSSVAGESTTASGTTVTTEMTQASTTVTMSVTTTTTRTTQTTQTTEATETTTTRTTETTTKDGSGQKTSWTVEVVKVIDGGTYRVEFRDGSEETVRLLGVDTLEVHEDNMPAEFEGVPSTQAGKDWLRDWAHKASEFARSEVGGKTITIETDEQADRRGAYGRLLVYAYAGDGKSVNERLIEQGYARLYDSSFGQRSEFTSDERTARENDVGLWNFESEDGSSGSDEDDGSAASQLTVDSVHEDADGNDHDNLNDEYVTLKNTGSSAIDLSGYTLADEADHTYRFPEGFTLEAGETVRVYTGSGLDAADELYWGSGSAVWNNDGDTILVTTDDGEVVVEREYSG